MNAGPICTSFPSGVIPSIVYVSTPSGPAISVIATDPVDLKIPPGRIRTKNYWLDLEVVEIKMPPLVRPAFDI